MFCSNCGNEVAESMQFCPECGSRIIKNIAEANVAEAITTDATKKPEDNKLYDVIVIIDKKIHSKIVMYLVTARGINMQNALKYAKGKYCVIGEKLSADEAFALAEKFEAEGAVVDIAESGVPYDPRSFSKDAGGISTDAAAARDPKKIKNRKLAATIIDFIGAISIALACVFTIFLPILKYGENTTSMLSQSILYIKGIIGNGFTFDIFAILRIVPVFCFAYVVFIAFRSIIPVFKKLKTLIGFNKNFVLREKPENVEQFLKNRKNSFNDKLLYELIGNYLMFYFITGVSGFNVPLIVTVGVLAVVYFVLNFIAKKLFNSVGA